MTAGREKLLCLVVSGRYFRRQCIVEPHARTPRLVGIRRKASLRELTLSSAKCRHGYMQPCSVIDAVRLPPQTNKQTNKQSTERGPRFRVEASLQVESRADVSTGHESAVPGS